MTRRRPVHPGGGAAERQGATLVDIENFNTFKNFYLTELGFVANEFKA